MGLSSPPRLPNRFLTEQGRLNILTKYPTTPYIQRFKALTYTRFRLLPVRSPLLRESLIYFIFLQVLRCFSSLAYLHSYYFIHMRVMAY